MEKVLEKIEELQKGQHLIELSLAEIKITLAEITVGNIDGIEENTSEVKGSIGKMSETLTNKLYEIKDSIINKLIQMLMPTESIKKLTDVKNFSLPWNKKNGDSSDRAANN